ncbi:MAG: hypothetical protein AAF299_07250 [Pseudomonadota bacterium]
MKNIAVALTALTIFAAPALADTIHTDGPGKSFSVNANVDAKQDFGATITPVRSNSKKKTNFKGGHVFQPHDLRR